MWPTLKKLEIHYGRYQHEKPVILRFSTEDILELNKHVEIARINSGATRPSGILHGKAASRGSETFKKFEECNYPIGEVVEVTFPGYCKLPEMFEIGSSPMGKWTKIG